MIPAPRHHLLLLLAITLLAAGCVGPPGAEDPSLRHTYSYEISVAVDRPVDDLVLRAPLPSVNNSSVIGEAMMNGSGYGLRTGWNASVVEANGTLLLELRVARFLPEYRGTPVAIHPGEPLPSLTPAPPATGPSVSNPVLIPHAIGATIQVNRAIETRDPAGREPLLGGGSGLATIACSLPGQGGGVRCYRHPVDAFVEYRGDAPVNVSLGVRLAGANERWRGGWTSNRYSDQVSIEFRPGEQGWMATEAQVTAGEGVYP